MYAAFKEDLCELVRSGPGLTAYSFLEFVSVFVHIPLPESVSDISCRLALVRAADFSQRELTETLSVFAVIDVDCLHKVLLCPLREFCGDCQHQAVRLRAGSQVGMKTGKEAPREKQRFTLRLRPGALTR